MPSKKTILISSGIAATVICGLTYLGLNLSHLASVQSYGADAPEAQWSLLGALSQWLSGTGTIGGVITFLIGLLTTGLANKNGTNVITPGGGAHQAIISALLGAINIASGNPENLKAQATVNGGLLEITISFTPKSANQPVVTQE